MPRNDTFWNIVIVAIVVSLFLLMVWCVSWLERRLTPLLRRVSDRVRPKPAHRASLPPRDGWSARTDEPTFIPGVGPQVATITTAQGDVRVVHARYSSDVPDGRGETELQAIWDFAAKEQCWRFLIDLPPFGPSSRRFFHALRVTGFCAISNGGTLVLRTQPPIAGSPDWFKGGTDETPYYKAVPSSMSTSDAFLLAATLVKPPPPPPQELD
jgi:hypothetical protein